MKIKYKFADETIEIEVEETWGAILIDLDRQEYNNHHAETRRHVSLDAYNADSNLVQADIDLFEDLWEAENREKLHVAILSLEPRQQRLIREIFFEGRKHSEIAAEEGVARSAVTHAAKRAIAKLRKILS